MAERYTIRVKTEFSGAHQLHGYDGPCARMHGHNWKVEAEVEARALDDIGMGVDFRELRGALETVSRELDHQVLNEIEPFTELNPTAENVAAHFFRRVALDLANQHGPERLRLAAITIWENDRSSVRYTEDSY